MSQKYGIIRDRILILSDDCLEGSKPVIFAEIPEFNQETQAVFQLEPVDMGDYIYAGNEVRGLPPQEEGEMIEG